MKNKIINRWGIIISSVLSFFGIFVGSFACVYGPPGGSEEEYYKLNQLKAEVEDLQKKLNDKEFLRGKFEKDIANYESKIKALERERDSLMILLKEFDK